MAVRFSIDFGDFVELEQNMARLPGKSENLMNEFFHSEGIEMATKDITELIPISKGRKSARNKKHAKTSDWSKSETFNLGFIIKSKGGAAKKKGSFGYLVFPDQGRGPHNLVKQDFMLEGLNNSINKIVEKLNLKLVQAIEEEL
ncbi:hypothetical protein [Niallia nealsonii]|nr:hypothetical protein [Niallia nealsonii]